MTGSFAPLRQRKGATAAPATSAAAASSPCPRISRIAAAVSPAATTSSGASQRLDRTSGDESMRGSSWYSTPASYQLFSILPDADAVRRREIELLTGLHIERLIPRVHVA